MTARNFLVRGLIAGLIAGFAAFAVAYLVGEPSVDRAIALEEAGAPAGSGAVGADSAEGTETHTHDDGATHSHTADDEGTTVSRADQSTWGLATGTLAVGLALGGIVALASAAVVGRLGRLGPAQSTAVVTLIGFVAFALVPFLKYPATPPAVGSGETIGERTGLYFVFLLVSLVAAGLAVAAARELWARHGAWTAVVGGTAFYLVVVVATGLLLPSVNEVGDFPADTLWEFRRASLLTLATIWAVIGVALTGLVTRLWQTESRAVARRELAASL